jgi:hypothetical protein
MGFITKVIIIAALATGIMLYFNGRIKNNSNISQVLSATEKDPTVNKLIDKTKNFTSNLFDQAKEKLIDTASHSAETVENFIVGQAASKVMEQINKLPTQQQEEIKKGICK